MSRYQYILFDLDGTLTDSADGIINSVLHALKKVGIEEDDREKLKAFVGPPLKASFMKYYGMTAAEAEAMIPLYREYFSVQGWKENSVYEGIPEVLQKLKDAGKTLIVATSKPEVFARKIMEYFELDQYFTYIGGSSMDGKISSKDQVIDYVLGEIGRDHMDEMIMVGDREHDVIGAKQNGLPCLGVLYGYGDRAELEQAGAAVICETVQELPQYLIV